VISIQVISHCERKPHKDIHRFEKISNIIKQFKLSCSKLAAAFQSMEVRNSRFAAFIDVFTPNTYVMVVMSDPGIRKLFSSFNGPLLETTKICACPAVLLKGFIVYQDVIFHIQ